MESLLCGRIVDQFPAINLQTTNLQLLAALERVDEPSDGEADLPSAARSDAYSLPASSSTTWKNDFFAGLRSIRAAP